MLHLPSSSQPAWMKMRDAAGPPEVRMILSAFPHGSFHVLPQCVGLHVQWESSGLRVQLLCVSCSSSLCLQLHQDEQRKRCDEISKALPGSPVKPAV